MIALFNSMKKRPVKVLLDLGTTGNFISDAMATVLKMQFHKEEDFHESTPTDKIVVLTIGYVQFVANCGL